MSRGSSPWSLWAVPELRRSLSFLFLEETSIRPEGAPPRPLIRPGEPAKRYPGSEKALLPRRWDRPGRSLWEVLQARRSRRDFQHGTVLSLAEVGLLLWASQGVTAQAGHLCLRTAPSAGATYPLETYVVAGRVEGLERGVWHLDVRGFQLEAVELGPGPPDAARAALGQGFIAQAGAVFVWSAVLRRTLSRYGNRGLRYVFMELGHACQNFLLAAEALGLSACPVAAFYDRELDALIGADGVEERALYLAAVTRPSLPR